MWLLPPGYTVFSHLECIVAGSGPFSVTSPHMEGGNTPLEAKQGGHPRAGGRGDFGEGVGWDG